jgi:uncharacterized membrane protein
MRDFGPIRKSGVGDTGDPKAAEAAAPYIGQARVLLGQLKNQMRMGGLLQLSRTVSLPDGTRISVSSRFGQDAVQIVPAPTNVPVNIPVIPPPPIHVPPYEFVPPPPLVLPPTIIVAGSVFAAPGASPYSTAVVWSGGGIELTIPLPGGQDVSMATGLSLNGAKVSGSAFNQSLNNGGVAFYSNRGALTTFAINDPDEGEPTAEDWTVANGITNNGTTIVGYGAITLAGTFTPYVWTVAAGLTPLPLPSGFTFYGTANAISTDGSTIVGAVMLNTGHQIPTACVWTASTTHGEVFNPYTGWSALPAYNPTTLSNGSADGSYATAVSKDGKIIVGCAVWYDGQITKPCYWENGVMTLLPDTLGNSMAYGVSDDGTTIVGSTDVLSLVEDEGFGGDYWQGLSTNLYTPWAGLSTQAFYWTAKKGITVLGPGCALASSKDGTYMTGWGAGGAPVVWSKSAGVIPLQLPAGSTTGCGAAITTG